MHGFVNFSIYLKTLKVGKREKLVITMYWGYLTKNFFVFQSKCICKQQYFIWFYIWGSLGKPWGEGLPRVYKKSRYYCTFISAFFLDCTWDLGYSEDLFCMSLILVLSSLISSTCLPYLVSHWGDTLQIELQLSLTWWQVCSR